MKESKLAASLGGRDGPWGLGPPLSYQELECNAPWGQKMMPWISVSQGVVNDIENKVKNCQQVAIPGNRSRVNWKNTPAAENTS